MPQAPQEHDGPAIDLYAARRAYCRAAATYAGAAVLAREVEARMLQRLDYIRLAPRRILDAGCGDGSGAKLLARRYPDAQILGLDFALPMLQAARGPQSMLRRLLSRRRLYPLCADFAAVPLPPASLGLAWSNLALHCANDPLAVFREMQRVLEANGLFMFSCYGPDTLKELRSAFSACDAAPHVHAFTDMHDLGDMLVASGFGTPVMDMEMITLTYADVDALVADLRATGQVNALAARRRGLGGKAAFGAMRAAYAALSSGGRLPASFEIVYGHAWKAQPRFAEDGRAIVKLDFPRARKS